jgi:hypothetical protein
MNQDEQLEQLINQTLDGALSTVPAHLDEIEQNKDIIKVENPKEFVYGLIVGSALTTGITGLVQIKKELPTPEDQIKIRDIVYKKIPQIRERIFG